MAPHLTPAEFDFIRQQEALGKGPVELHKALTRRRARQGLATPTLPRFRLALRGVSYKRSRKETRGRKANISRSSVLKLNSVRKKLIKKAQGQREVRWEDVCKSSRVRKVHRTTLLRAFRRENIPVQARSPRLKPGRTSQQAAARVAYCKKWARKPAPFFVDDVDLIIDNKQFDIPTTQRARQYMAAQRVRFHLRTPAEGVQPEMTKPGRKKNRMNTGAVAKVCAGISNGRIVMWEYLTKRWTGEEAAKLYQGAIIKTLKKARGVKPKYHVFEDNDPTGYKSKAGMKAKAELGIDAIPMPVFSPDLNPLDFCLWEEITRRMVERQPKHVETVKEFKKRMRMTALRLSPSAGHEGRACDADENAGHHCGEGLQHQRGLRRGQLCVPSGRGAQPDESRLTSVTCARAPLPLRYVPERAMFAVLARLRCPETSNSQLLPISDFV